MPSEISITDDAAWAPLRRAWKLREGTIYLNHGSFGPPPVAVQETRRDWQQRLDAQPMDFFVRTLEQQLLGVRTKLAKFVGTTAENLILVDNATYAMNIVAESFQLAAGDEVLLTDHEYGAVRRSLATGVRSGGGDDEGCRAAAALRVARAGH